MAARDFVVRSRRAAPCVVLAATATLAGAQTTGDWSVSVRQSGKTLDVGAPMRLKKEPFEFVFQGPSDMAYGLFSSRECDLLASHRSEGEIAKLIRPMNISAETVERNNRDWVVNGVGAIKADDNTAQLWAEDKSDQKLSFQKFDALPNGRAQATREINQVFLYTNFKSRESVPIQKASSGEVCVLVAGLPPVGRMTYRKPLVLRFMLE